MKKFEIVKPYYRDDTYIIIEGSVIELQYYKGEYWLQSNKEFDHSDLIKILNVICSETPEELYDTVPECLYIQNWKEVIKEIQSKYKGKVISGIWKSGNLFTTEQGEEIKVAAFSGVLDYAKNNYSFPIKCKVILKDSGLPYKTIAYVLNFIDA